jgi:hypothetical protein
MAPEGDAVAQTVYTSVGEAERHWRDKPYCLDGTLYRDYKRRCKGRARRARLLAAGQKRAPGSGVLPAERENTSDYKHLWMEWKLKKRCLEVHILGPDPHRAT